MHIVTLFLLLWLQKVSVAGDYVSQQHWQQRFLIGVQEDKQAWQTLVGKLKTPEMRAEFKDRKLLVLVVVEDQLLMHGAVSGSMDSAATAKGIQARLSEYTLPGYALVGLDGGIKAFYPGTNIDVPKMLLSIDRMPMRQAELKARTCLLYTSPSPRD